MAWTVLARDKAKCGHERQVMMKMMMMAGALNTS